MLQPRPCGRKSSFEFPTKSSSQQTLEENHSILNEKGSRKLPLCSQGSRPGCKDHNRIRPENSPHGLKEPVNPTQMHTRRHARSRTKLKLISDLWGLPVPSVWTTREIQILNALWILPRARRSPGLSYTTRLTREWESLSFLFLLLPPPPLRVLQSLEGKISQYGILKAAVSNFPSNPKCHGHPFTYWGPLQKVGGPGDEGWEGLEKPGGWESETQTLAGVRGGRLHRESLCS